MSFLPNPGKSTYPAPGASRLHRTEPSAMDSLDTLLASLNMTTAFSPSSVKAASVPRYTGLVRCAEEMSIIRVRSQITCPVESENSRAIVAEGPERSSTPGTKSDLYPNPGLTIILNMVANDRIPVVQ